MSDFIAHVIADLDTSKAASQLAAFTSAKHKIDVDVNLISQNGNINGILNQIKAQFTNAGNQAGANFANSINSSLGRINVNNAVSQISNLQRVLKSMNFKSSSIDTITQNLQQMDLAVTKVTTRMNGQNLNVRIDGIDQMGRAISVFKEFDAASGRMQRTSETISQSVKNMFTDADASKLNASLSALNASFSKLKGSSNEYSTQLATLKTDLGNIKSIPSLDKQQAEFERISQEVQLLTSKYKELSAEEQRAAQAQQLVTKKESLGNQITAWMNNNTKAAKAYRQELQSLKQLQQNATTQSQLQDVNSQFSALKQKARADGNVGNGFLATLKKNMTSLSPLFSMGSMINTGIRGLKDMYQNVVKIDSAMTELRKVTDESDSSYTSYMKDAATESKRIGTTISDYINSTADFARLGNSLNDSKTLATAANVYTVVGDEISGVDEATKSIISTMQAFDIQAQDSMSIVDKYNEVGNRFAISSGGIGDAMTRSASSMEAAGNTIDQSIALITAANTVVQDPSKVGNAFKTIAMRIRGAKTELEAAGEDTDGMAESTAKLREEIKALSGVDIMSDDNTFKSTYQVLDELAVKWKDLTDIQQASITELIAGKHQGNVMSSLMDNFDTARQALEVSQNSEGSAMKEHDKWMESIQAKQKKLAASWQAFSQSIMNSDLIKVGFSASTGFVDFLTGLIDKFSALSTLLVGGGIVKGIKSIV